MEKMQRDFKGVWIPAEIWLSEQLSLIEKVLFVEIYYLDNERGCYAANAHFAKFFGVSDRQIRNIIASLKSKGFIIVTVRNRNERVIRAAGKWRRPTALEMDELGRSRTQLIRKMRMPGSGEVGRKFPGR